MSSTFEKDSSFPDFQASLSAVSYLIENIMPNDVTMNEEEPPNPNGGSRDALLILLPLLIVLSTLLFLLLIFLLCVLFLRRRRGIVLHESDGPVDMTREELIDGEGGFEIMEERWLESVDEETRRAYSRAKDFQTQYPPNSLPTDITLSQFLSIQEKGVSAWAFEPDYELMPALLVHARTELTFLPDPSTSSCVQSNLPLPKLNEVYYWEVKMFDLPETTAVAIGLATKPYPAFRLPGLNRFSVAYHSNGDKSHNYPFTSQAFGPALKEGDVLGVGYRPRTGTVFFTRNGRKMEDAFIGLLKWNLFPTIGADGPCSLHVNLGQSGFVFIEANVKKWGLAPSVGTLAPPPAYGSERGSILLEAGGQVRLNNGSSFPAANSSITVPSPSTSSRRSHRSRRPERLGLSPTGHGSLSSSGAIRPIQEELLHEEETQPTPPENVTSSNVVSIHNARSEIERDREISAASSRSSSTVRRSQSPLDGVRNEAPNYTNTNSASALAIRLHPPPESPMDSVSPIPNQSDIHMQSMSTAASRATGESTASTATLMAPSNDMNSRPPPAYSPIDAYRYSDGVQVDLPAEVIAAALEGSSIPANFIGQAQGGRSERRSPRRER